LLARSLGFAEPEAFEEKLAAVRAGVRRHYDSLFTSSTREDEMQEWTLFLSGSEPSPALREKWARWFPHSEDVAARVRKFALGEGGPLTREQVGLLVDVSPQFDATRLARPLQALERITRFGERYGAPRMFLKALVGNLGLLSTLGLLFDRSTAIYEWLCAHPGIMEELLHEVARRHKTVAEVEAELEPLAREPKDFSRLLWLYVKAEQVRAAMAELLYQTPLEKVEERLTDLADGALNAALRLTDPAGRLAVIALGKYGGGELGIGSDLDIIVLAPDDATAADTERARAWRELLDYRHPLGRAIELDLRLRPHGRDGPFVTTLAALRAYHGPGGAAQGWERQMLTRARPAAGSKALGAELLAWREGLIYTRPAPTAAREDLRHMRFRIEEEKTRPSGSERAFKAGPGGLLDVEFAAQWLQLAHGAETPAVRAPSTRTVLRAAKAANLLSAGPADALLEHYEVLRQVEQALRRDAGTGVALLPEEPRALEALACWLGRPNAAALRAELRERRAAVRALFDEIVAPAGGRN
jgi:glutamate-ammonia-ligase adenylyltransferase